MPEKAVPRNPAENRMKTIHDGIHVTGALGNDVSTNLYLSAADRLEEADTALA